MNRIVSPRNLNSPSPLMLVGEAPGARENQAGVAFIGQSGQLLDHFCYLAGLTNPAPYITNLVKQWTGPGDPDPTAEEIRRDEGELWGEIRARAPLVICPLGAVATRWFLGDVSMEMVHGIPHEWLEGVTVIPCYHPAAGLRDPYAASYCQADIQAAADLLNGRLSPPIPTRKPSNATLLLPETRGLGFEPPIVAMDTEGFPGAPWGVSFSTFPEEGLVAKSPNIPSVSISPHVRVALHHALHDLPILRELGITIPDGQLEDTMVAAYCLQLEPQALKVLAARHLGLKMQEFNDLVAPYFAAASASYLEQLAARDWGKPEPVLEVESKTGLFKLRQPQALQRRAKGALQRKMDFSAFWKATPPATRSQVESSLGPAPSPHDIGLVPDSEAIPYSAQDAASTVALFPILLEKLRARGLEQVYRLDMAVLPMVAEMMETGVPIDRVHFDTLGPILDARMTEIQERVQGKYNRGRHINLRSGDQVAELLYKTLGMRPPKLTDTGVRGKTDEKALQTLAMLSPHPVLAEIVNFREVATLKSSFVTKLPKHVSADGRIHCTMRMTRIVTGRIATADPNMQAVPTHSELGKEVRNGFVAPPGYLFTSHDLDQVEMRWMAIVSGDRDLIDLFNSGVDVHSTTASRIFGIPLDQVNRGLHRLVAKKVGFGIINGIEAKGLLDQLYLAGIDAFGEADCAAFIEGWFRAFPGVKRFMEECRREGMRQGYVQDYWGRIRYLPNIRCPIKYLRGEEERASHSMKIQAGAQGLMKRGMARVWGAIKEWRKDGLDIRPVLQIHDELVCLVPEEWVEFVIPEIVRLMEEDSGMFPVKIGCKGVSGKRWGDLKD